MDFLYLYKNKVHCSEGGFTLPEVKKIWNNDKTGKEKSYFNDVITGIYFIYKPRGIFWNKPVEERIVKVNKDYLKNSKWDDIVRRDGVDALIEIYRDLTLTINERMIEGIKNDFIEISKVMDKLPMLVKYNLKTTINVSTEDGVIHQVPVDREIEIPNMKKKEELYESWLSMSKMIKQVEDNLKIEEVDRVKEEAEKRMFDSRENYEQPEELS